MCFSREITPSGAAEWRGSDLTAPWPVTCNPTGLLTTSLPLTALEYPSNNGESYGFLTM